LRVVAIRLYEKVFSIFRNTKGWSEKINCNTGVKQGCPLPSTFFGIYINKLEGCFEEAGCVALTLANIVIILLIYIDDIILMVRSPYDLDKQLKILKDFCSSTGMIVNTNKMKVMIFKSKKI
jgi:hypothetical protein